MPKSDASFCSRVNVLTAPDELAAMLDALDTGSRPLTCLTVDGVAASKKVDTEVSRLCELGAGADQVQFAWRSKGENSPRFLVSQGVGDNTGAGCVVALEPEPSPRVVTPSQRQLPLGERERAARKATKSLPLPNKGWRKTTTAEKVVVALEVSSARSGYAATLKFSPRFATALCNHGDPTRLFSDAINRSFKERLSGFVIPYGFVFEFSLSGVLHAHGVFIPASNSSAHLDRIKRAFMAAGGAIKGRSASRQCSFVADHDGGWTGYVMKELSITACKLGTDKVVFLSRELRALAREHLTMDRRKAFAFKDKLVVAPMRALPRVEETLPNDVIETGTLPARSDFLSDQRHCDGAGNPNRLSGGKGRIICRQSHHRDASACVAVVNRKVASRSDDQLSRRVPTSAARSVSRRSVAGRTLYRAWAARARGHGLHRYDKATFDIVEQGVEGSSRRLVYASLSRGAPRRQDVALWPFRRGSAHSCRQGCWIGRAARRSRAEAAGSPRGTSFTRPGVTLS